MAWMMRLSIISRAAGRIPAPMIAETVSVASLDYVLDRDNPLFAKLEAFLRQ